MALFTPSESPAVVTREIDLTNGVPNVPTSTGAFVGNFRWGPVDQPVLVNNEASLVKNFGNPDADTTVDFHSASYYLRYSDDLYVVREITEVENPGPEVRFSAAIDSDGTTLTVAVLDAGGGYVAAPTVAVDDPDSGSVTVTANYDSDTNSITSFTVTGSYTFSSTPTVTLSGGRAEFAVNAYDNAATPSTVPIVKNLDNFDAQDATLAAAGHTFIAKWPGSLGNSLKVSMVSSDSDFNTWTYKQYFDAAPGTSDHASGKLASNDEVHLIVVDENGDFTGTRGEILETFSFVSLASDAKDFQGASNYIKDVVNQRSRYVWLSGFPTGAGTNAGTAATSGKDYAFSGEVTASLVNGANSGTLVEADYAVGFANFDDVNTLLVDFLIAPGMATSVAQTTVVNNLVTIAESTRKDCIVIASPHRDAVVGSPTTARANTITGVSGFTRSSYLFVDNNYLKVYDKFNDSYVFIPAASSTAGIMAATDNNFAPWYSPAGNRRGQYFGVTSLAYNPNKTDRDELYKAGVNSISNIPGQGVLLYGDRTHLARPSAFDRINVRRLFLVLERAVAAAAGNILFEFNDEFTRAEFVNIIEPLLRDVKGRRGITDFKLVCDETNNTPDIVDTNQFVASLFIKPARSINFITLNFVAVRSGVSFEEIVGDNRVSV